MTAHVFLLILFYNFTGEYEEQDMVEKKEFEECMAQAEDITGRSVSESSDGQIQHSQTLTSDFSADSSKLPASGLIVGTTPSQMSPSGTPVHHHTEPQEPFISTSTPTAATTGVIPINPPGYQSQSSVPGSPFPQPSPDIKSSSVFSPFGTTAQSDDAFSSILSVSDQDRRHDAWIPSDATSHILFSMATNSPGTFIPTPEQLSTPGIIYNEPMVCIFIS